jgi:predicted transposase YdaD
VTPGSGVSSKTLTIHPTSITEEGRGMREINLKKYSEADLATLEGRIKEERERREKLKELKKQFAQIAEESGLTLEEVMRTTAPKRGRPRKKS